MIPKQYIDSAIEFLASGLPSKERHDECLVYLKDMVEGQRDRKEKFCITCDIVTDRILRHPSLDSVQRGDFLKTHIQLSRSQKWTWDVMIIHCHQTLLTERTPPKLLALFAMEGATEQGKFKRGARRKIELQDKLILPFVASVNNISHFSFGDGPGHRIRLPRSTVELQPPLDFRMRFSCSSRPRASTVFNVYAEAGSGFAKNVAAQISPPT